MGERNGHNADHYPRPAARLAGILDNVWEWVSEISAASPIQPTANLGHGTIEFNPPLFAVEAHQAALLDVNCNQYGPTMGRARLKIALANLYSTIHNQPLNTDTEIAITTGATAAILSSLMAFVETGDEVIVIEPLFNLYGYLIRFVGGIVKPVCLQPPAKASIASTPADDWTLDVTTLRKTFSHRTKMLIINTPHNPLGKIFSQEELRSIGDLCVSNDVVVLSDEVYEHLNYNTGEKFPRIATLSPQIFDRTISIGSVGKTFNATGWRIGYAVGNQNLIKHVQWAHVLLSYVPPGPAQEAAAVAYETADKEGFWNYNKQLFKSKVDNLCSFLDSLGLSYVVPSGAYFIFVHINKVVLPKNYNFPLRVAKKGHDWKLCYYISQDLGVSSIPGSAFFSEGNASIGESYLRFIVCKTDEQLELAKDRLRGLRALITTTEATTADDAAS